jgi:hypothetical protein
MTDRIEHVLHELRRQTLPTIIAPGPDAARSTVRRKREIRAAAGSLVAVAAVAVGINVAHRPAAEVAAPPSDAVGVPLPDPDQAGRADAAGRLLGDPNQHPWVMATQATVDGTDYENDVNDIGAGRYVLSVFCVGPGRLSVQVKADQYGNQILARGTVPCGERPPATIFDVTQPHSGYLRFFAHAENGAAGTAGIAFKFTRAD